MHTYLLMPIYFSPTQMKLHYSFVSLFLNLVLKCSFNWTTGSLT